MPDMTCLLVTAILLLVWLRARLHWRVFNGLLRRMEENCE